MDDMKFLDTLEEVLLERGFPLNIVQSVLETVQTSDAVEVVRCKDCIYWDGLVCDVHSEWPDAYSTGHMDYTNADDFCNYGERKEDA